MPNWLIGALSIGIVFSLTIIEIVAGVDKPFSKALFNIVMGIAALIAVNITTSFTGVSIAVSPLSLGISAAGGIPGVTMIVVMNLII